MLSEQRGHFQRDVSVSVGCPPRPRRHIGWETKASVIGGCDVHDETVDRADLDALAGAASPVGEDGTGRVGVGEDEQAIRTRCCEFAGIIGALVGLAAARRRLDHHQRQL